jgi:hypothetical protein
MQDDGQAAASSRPWFADALDPAENLRALADVHAFGRRAVEDLADRIQAWGDAPAGSGTSDGAPDGTGTAVADVVEQLRGDAALAGEGLARLAEHTVTLLGVLIDRLPGGPRATGSGSTLTPPHAAPGTTTAAVFWVHNSSAAVVPAVRPHCAPPRSHLGGELPPDAVTFDPPVLDPLPGRSSCGIEVRVQVPPDTVPGQYVTVLMAANVPDLYLSLQVTVSVPEPAG